MNYELMWDRLTEELRSLGNKGIAQLSPGVILVFMSYITDF